MATDNKISGELKDLLLDIENNPSLTMIDATRWCFRPWVLLQRRDYKLASAKTATRIPTTGWLL